MIALVIILVVFLLWLVSRYRRMTILQRNGIKGPRPNFIFGHSREILGPDNLSTINKWIKKYGPIVGYYSGGKPAVICMDPELLKLVQIKDFHLFTDRLELAKGRSHPSKEESAHVAAAKSTKWKETRSVLTPTFSAAKLKKMLPLMNNAIDDLMVNIQNVGGNGTKEFDIQKLFQGLTMDVIGRTAFGVRSDCQKITNTEHPFITASKRIFRVRPGFLLMVNAVFPELTFLLYPMRKVEAFITKWMGICPHTFLFDVCRKILNERRAHPDANKHDLLQQMIDAKMSHKDIDSMKGHSLTASTEGDDGPENAPKERDSGSAQKSDRVMSEEEIVGNAFLFLEAGYETTSTALSFIAHVMVNYPDVQEKMREEVLQLYQREGKLDYNSLSSLPFMEAVIQETLRIYPPVTMFVTRVASVDYKYKNITIPKGAAVVAPAYQLHHNPDFWEDPEKFDPNRFLGANKSKINPVLWQPFGTGPRNCIGMRFAFLEMKLALGQLLLKYRLEPGPSTELGSLTFQCKVILLGPKNGIFVKAIPLKK